MSMLEHNLFVVSEKTKFFSSNGAYEIRDSEGNVLGTAVQTTGLMAKLIGMAKGPPSTKIEFKEAGSEAPVFTLRRRGFLFKKIELIDGKGTVLGRYKSKRFSLSGGFHVYDESGKHIAEIRGKMMKFEYTFFTPDGKTEMGKVSKKWGGAMKELFTSADTYGVEIKPAFAENTKAKMLILGAAVAIDCLMGAKGGAVAAAGGEEAESED
ncbi:MAG: hypothetical protein K8U57_34120 [Planctomycetes bacterium]|nr:hypothetical protein [Planctomycetota bacterium]